MTEQIREKLIYDGVKYWIESEPLEHYFWEEDVVRPIFSFQSMALWRGYVGTWEILNANLYLIGIAGRFDDGQEVTLESIFPAYGQRVFASWFSGTITIPEEGCRQYIDFGDDVTDAINQVLEFKNGVMTKISRVVRAD